MYFHTDNLHDQRRLIANLEHALNNGKSFRASIDSFGRLSIKVGEGMWSAPIESTFDMSRDKSH